MPDVLRYFGTFSRTILTMFETRLTFTILAIAISEITGYFYGIIHSKTQMLHVWYIYQHLP